MPPPATIQSTNNSAPRKIPLPSPTRIRTYILRLPLFTRIILFVILAAWLCSYQSAWSIIDWGALTPDLVGLGSMYRLNTYPLVHLGFLHMLIDTICLIPLLERFETEWGTLTSVALFLGPLSTLPGGIYVLIERYILRFNTTILGSSIWVFLLLGNEAIKTYRTHPHFDIAGYLVPTWISPIALIVIMSMLFSTASFLGHICGCLIGYLFGLGYLKFLAPPEKVLRWIEGKLNLLGRVPHFVSVDQKTYGRYGVLPQSSAGRPNEHAMPVRMSWLNLGGSSTAGQRLGP